jgi:CPA1 family monovalent cation:H+ antiporter
VFRVAETLGASGVIAVVVASLIINYRIRYFGGAGKESMETLDTMWEFIGFFASSIAFIFIGSSLELSTLISSSVLVIILFLFLLIARFSVVHVITKILEQIHRQCIPLNWRHGLFWSGLRGAVSIVLVQGLSKTVLPHSSTMMALTFGIVLISNLVHGPTIPFVIQRLKIFTGQDSIIEHSNNNRWDSYTEEYIIKGYDYSRSKFEKIFFSAPEFFVRETNYGVNLERKLRVWWEKTKNRFLDIQNSFNNFKGF